MFPHPNTVIEVRTLQNRDLLTKAAQERLAREAPRHAPSPSWMDSGHSAVVRMLASISAMAATSLSLRRLARA